MKYRKTESVCVECYRELNGCVLWECYVHWVCVSVLKPGETETFKTGKMINYYE